MIFHPPIINDIFQKQENYYPLRNQSSLISKRKFTYPINTISFRVPQFWQNLPQDIKKSDSLNLFNSNMKRYGTLTCHCKIFKTFVPCVSYID